jgi:hypothetical protein
MKRLLFRKSTALLWLITLTAVTSTGFSQKASERTTKGGNIRLVYNYPAEVPVMYLNINKITQSMDIQGQPIDVYVNSAFGCSVRQTGKDGNNLKLEIRVDTIGQIVDSPQGYAGGAVSGVSGKLFNILIAPDGKEIDVSEAEKIVYNIEGSGETNVLSNFIDFFPDLPTGNIKPGDTWDSSDSIKTDSPSMSMKMVYSLVNKLEGIENFNGVECARITSEMTGTRSMSTMSQGMEIYTSGSFTGTGTMFFAINEGYFINQTLSSKMTGNVEMYAPQAMTFPLVMDINSVIDVKK